MPWTVLLFASLAFTAQSQADSRCETARIEVDRNMVTLSWKVPAAFPNNASTKTEFGAFSLECPTFSAKRSADGLLVLHGTTLTEAFKRLGWQRGEPRVFESFRYRWPSLNKGWSDYWLNVVVTEQGLTLKPGFDQDSLAEAEYRNPFREITVAVRVDGRELQPVMFEAKITPVDFSTGEVFEFFSKVVWGGRFTVPYDPNDIKIPRFTITPKKGEITVYPLAQATFPEK